MQNKIQTWLCSQWLAKLEQAQQSCETVWVRRRGRLSEIRPTVEAQCV